MSAPKIKAAVCAVFAFENKIFYIKRQNYLRNFPGYHSFPGGKVNREEVSTTLLCDFLSEAEDKDKLLSALVRETQEELGISLSELQQKKVIQKITYCAKAVTPDFNPYRFATHYFFIRLNELVEFRLDETEFQEGLWLKAKDFLQMYEEGEVLTVRPILEFSKKVQKADPDCWIEFESRDKNLCPMIEPIKGLMQFMPLSNTLPPANRTNSFLIGDDSYPKILVDPSPKDEKELEKFLKTILPYRPTHIFITHHHGDHHQFAPEIARKFNLPMMMSALTFDYLNLKRGEAYLAGIRTELVAHDQVLTQSRGKKVRAYAVPGHDLGQLALVPSDLRWFIAGDLFQGVGSVVVGGEQASMSEYFKTLKDVIALDPYCVVPSHGIALGGTEILKKNLEHRKFREKQIKKLLEENLSIEEMTRILYQGLPEDLLKYAKANVESHLQKISMSSRGQD